MPAFEQRVLQPASATRQDMLLKLKFVSLRQTSKPARKALSITDNHKKDNHADKYLKFKEYVVDILQPVIHFG